ncbi:hypothetical protein Pelo_19660 [Pelomyxa schiedti]|nr:hypothetical protein Pelo_19660 [Pelomyxa schiedti]
MAGNHQVSVRVVYPSARHATIVATSVAVDKELRPELITRSVSTDENALLATFSSTDVKHLRASVSGFFESVTLASETLNAFDSF